MSASILPRATTLGDLVTEMATRGPDAPAICFVSR